MKRILLALLLGGCSAVLHESNAGIPLLEGGPTGEVATGAKYAGWLAGGPVCLVSAPIAALAWATPWVDLADAADIATAPSIGLGYTFESLVGFPLYAASFWADDRDDTFASPDAPNAFWGLVTAHRPCDGHEVAPLESDDIIYYAVPDGAAARLAARLQEESSVPLDGFAGTLELTLADSEEPRPLVLLTPPSEATFAARWLASRLARKGFHAAVIVPEDEVFLDPALDAQGIEEKLRRAVVAARTAVAALSSRSDVSRIEYLGVSAGGIFGTVLLATEPRIERAVLVMPGGDLPRIAAESLEGTVRAYRESWRERGVDVREAFAGAIRTDPLRLARHVDPRKVLLFLSDDDTVVPIACGLELRQALGCPETYFLAGDHETAGICFGFVIRTGESFLELDPVR
jgi:hypothetical protein